MSVALSLTTSAMASGPGTTGSPFLKVPISGRAVALGGAVGGLTGDIDNFDYNPAAITNIDRINILAAYVNYLEDTSLQAASIGFPISVGSAAAQQETMKGAEFTPNRLAMGLEYRQFKANDTRRSDVLGVEGDQFDIRSQLFQVGVAYPITARFGIGAAVKMITDKVESKTAKSNGGDIGITTKLSSHWALAAAVQNLGSSGQFETTNDPLPRQLRGSAAYTNSGWMAMADVAAGADGVLRTAAGLEFALGPIVRLRGGAYHDTDFEFAGGLGLRLRGPQKAGRVIMRPPVSTPKAGGSPLSIVAQSIIDQSAAKLIEAALASNLLISPSPIAIYPLNSKDVSGVVISDRLDAAFRKSKDFSVLAAANRDHSDTMLVGNVEDQGETLIVNTRLLIADSAETVAADHFEIAKEDLYAPKQITLTGTDSIQAEARSYSSEPSFTSLDLGLDYGFTTQKDLGITHTFSIKILY
jgi:hypothetical protein